MNGINQISLEEHKGEYENRPLTSMLYYSGQALGIKVPGYVIDKQYYLPPVTFDADELEAIGLGINMVRQWTDEKFAAKANSAFDKIQAILPASLQGELQQIATYSVDPECKIPWCISFSDLRECIRARQKVDVAYIDESQRSTNRIIYPLGLFFFSPVWLLAAWCEKRNDFRHFRLDRIQHMQRCESFFDDEPNKNLSEYLRRHACSDN